MRPPRPGRIYPAGVEGVTERVVRLSTGLEMRVVEAGPSGGHPVVLVPGWGCSAYLFHRNIPALAAAGLRVHAPDFPGHWQGGRAADRAAYTLPGLAAELVALLDALALPRADIVGQSMGAAIAMRVAATQRERVRRLALIAPAGLGRLRHVKLAAALLPRWLAPLLPFLAQRWLVRIMLRRAYGGLARPSAEDVEQYLAPVREPGAVRALQALLLGVDWRPLGDTALSVLTVPVLVVHGGRDVLLDPLEVASRAAHIPHAQRLEIAGAGHAVHDEAAERVNAALVSFLVL